MSAHLDLDALADLLAGEGPDAHVEHLSACPACSAALVDLEQAQEQVRTALAALPAPEVPADLAARLDAALLEARPPEPAARPVGALAASPGAEPDDDDDDERDGDERDGAPAPLRPAVALPRQRRSAGSPWLLRSAAAAGFLLVLGGGALAVRQSATSSDSAATAAPASSTADRASAPPRTVLSSESGRDYGAGRSALETALPELLDEDVPLSRTEQAPAGTPSAEGALPSPDALSSLDTESLDRLHDPEELAGCLSGLSEPGRDGVPLALDYASYDGRPALVVVLPSEVQRRVDVFVVGAGCRAGAEQTLLFTRLPRP